jgi:glycosyltransferase involved in cell wall biosynthesis
MEDYICLEGKYSTTRLLVRAPAAVSTGDGAAAGQYPHGGLRFKGYGKRSFPGLPLITVITVVLNEPTALEKTIRSVLEQTYANIEFIIIDGGSSGPTLEVIKGFDDRIDCWTSAPDHGIFDAMNKGIDLATGEWINFLNAGDFFYEKDTTRVVFNKNYGDADFIYGHTYFLGGDFKGVVKAWDFSILWKTMIFTHQSLFTHSRILKNRKFDTTFKICADYDIIYNSYMEGRKFFNADIVIAAFDPGFSDASRSRMAYEKWKVVKKYRKDFAFHAFYLKLFLKRLYRDIGKRLKRHGALK